MTLERHYVIWDLRNENILTAFSRLDYAKYKIELFALNEMSKLKWCGAQTVSIDDILTSAIGFYANSDAEIISQPEIPWACSSRSFTK